LEGEREIIGQTVARLPVSLGVEIGRTPQPGEPLRAALEAVASCDLYMFLLGRDIAAPAGVEWDVAIRSDKQPLALVKDVLRTPAATAFLRDTPARWTEFSDHEELAELVQQALVQHLLGGALKYGLSVPEYEALSALADGTSAGDQEELGIGSRQDMGAGGGGVVLGRHSLPSGGTLIEDPQ
jgi:hypothetical protein